MLASTLSSSQPADRVDLKKLSQPAESVNRKIRKTTGILTTGILECQIVFPFNRASAACADLSHSGGNTPDRARRFSGHFFWPGVAVLPIRSCSNSSRWIAACTTSR
jgi:hypothetical protein